MFSVVQSRPINRKATRKIIKLKDRGKFSTIEQDEVFDGSWTEISSCSHLLVRDPLGSLGQFFLLEENLIVHRFSLLLSDLQDWHWMKSIQVLGIHSNAGSFISICVVDLSRQMCS